MLWGKPMLNFSFPSYITMPNTMQIIWEKLVVQDNHKNVRKHWILIVFLIQFQIRWMLGSGCKLPALKYIHASSLDASLLQQKHHCYSKSIIVTAKVSLLTFLCVDKIANGRDGWCDWLTSFLEKAMQACVRHQYSLASNAGDSPYTSKLMKQILFDDVVLLTGAL